MQIQRAVPLKKYTTFRIGGLAEYFCAVKTTDELIEVSAFAKAKKLPFFILGGGSNLLVSDKGFGGLVIKIENCKLKIENSCIIADAGISLGKLVNAAANASLSGLEWATGIPGATVGGAIRGNAGAFQAEMKDIVQMVETVNSKDLKIKKFNHRDCHFSYRSSIFKKNPNLIIISAELNFKKEKEDKVKEKSRKILNYRKLHHPSQFSAGSIFKNLQFTVHSFQKLVKKYPEFKQFKKRGDIPAAFLISECGLKGKKFGRAEISEKHPNFIINLGGAKASDVLALINLVKKSVKQKYQINLEEEIQLLV